MNQSLTNIRPTTCLASFVGSLSLSLSLSSYPKDCKAAVEQMCSQGLIQDLCLALSQLDLEVCRDITTCINTAACYACAETGEKPGVEHLQKNQQIFDILR